MRRSAEWRAVLCAVLALFLVCVAPPAQASDELWARATHHMRAGAPDAALPLLEQLVSDDPRNKAYRFELGYALYLLGQDRRARYHLELVRGAGLSDAEATAVNALIAEIDDRRVWSAYARFEFKPESNAARQTDARGITIGSVPVLLDPSARGRASTSVITQAGAGVRPPLTKTLRLNINADLYAKLNEEQRFRDVNLFLRAGLEIDLGSGRAISGGVLAGHRWLYDASYSDTHGVFLTYRFLPGPRSDLSVFAEVSRTTYKGLIASTQRSFIVGQYNLAVSNNALLSFSGFFEDTQSADASLAGNRYGASVSGIYAFQGGLIGGLRIAYETDRRDGPPRLFPNRRIDQTTTLQASLGHRSFRIGPFVPELIIGVEDNASTIALTEYTNRYLSFGLTRKF